PHRGRSARANRGKNHLTPYAESRTFELICRRIEGSLNLRGAAGRSRLGRAPGRGAPSRQDSMLTSTGVSTAPSRAFRTRRAKTGLTLIEVLCALTILMVSVLGFSQAITASAKSAQTTREKTIATQAARRMIEEIEANVFAEAFWRYNALDTDDPGGTGTAQGANFAVLGLRAREDDADGMAGEIEFPIRPGFPGNLREDIVNVPLGMPRDLNGDNVIDTLNHAGNYRILPVLVRVRWRGVSGNCVVELRTMLGDY
ncbi:MAG: prepilin-type N-terminal cleavage/methylation domain-containing protein, partial [Kofleriaceae bacterium]